jgi:hypothetical protein
LSKFRFSRKDFNYAAPAIDSWASTQFRARLRKRREVYEKNYELLVPPFPVEETTLSAFKEA